jgi:beta-galactosidase
MAVFQAQGQQFTLDGAPHRLLAGAIHYFRVLPQLWKDRLLKLRACGLNTVETYVAWNLHEPRPGEFHFEGGLDIAAFLRQAQEVGLHAIVRPGPYICSEWDFGGLPAWLLADPAMRVRCLHQPYLQAVDRFCDALLPRLAPLQVTKGGPILAMQIENEYGSFGNDQQYLKHLEDGLRRRGVDVLLFTSDGASDSMLQGGTLPHIQKTANFGGRATEQFKKLKEYQPDAPLMCAEFWVGWFDHWGYEHHRRDADDAAATLDEILSAGASVSIYMFHGGTNFGFMNGANFDDDYRATVSSYDDDAPLDEAGDPTPKYWAFRKVIEKYAPLPAIEMPPPSRKKAFGTVQMSAKAPLFGALDALSKPVQKTTPEPMEMLGQDYGFILYRTRLTGPRDNQPLSLQEVHDRAQIFLDGKLVGIVGRNPSEPKLRVTVPKDGAQLDILVENMGRINYGPRLLDRKGITEGVRLDYQFQYHWTIFPLPMNNLSGLRFGPVDSADGPAFFRGIFRVDEPADTFLALPGWTKGNAWINGFNLGRYWKIGPTRTLYVPAPLLKTGDNELIVFELHGAEKPQAELRDHLELG